MNRLAFCPLPLLVGLSAGTLVAVVCDDVRGLVLDESAFGPDTTNRTARRSVVTVFGPACGARPAVSVRGRR